MRIRQAARNIAGKSACFLSFRFPGLFPEADCFEAPATAGKGCRRCSLPLKEKNRLRIYRSLFFSLYMDVYVSWIICLFLQRGSLGNSSAFCRFKTRVEGEHPVGILLYSGELRYAQVGAAVRDQLQLEFFSVNTFLLRKDGACHRIDGMQIPVENLPAPQMEDHGLLFPVYFISVGFLIPEHLFLMAPGM